MTLVSKLRKKLADDRPSAEPHDIQVADADSGAAATLSGVQRDGLSCLALELRVRRPAPKNQDMRQWAERLVKRISSLLEPLQVLEIDTTKNQALLRTAMPAQHHDKPAYFEMILDGTTSAVLRRYQAASVDAETTQTTRRQQQTFALTNEGLLKLVADIIG